jgi:hypothetical protein
MSISNLLYANRYNLYCRNITIDGDLIINGNIVFSSLLPSSILYLDNSKQLKSKQLNNGQLMVGSTGSNPVGANITTSTLNIVNGPGTISIDTLSGSTFDNVTLIGSSNQLIFKSNNTTPTTTITTTNPASNRIITLSDPGGDDYVAYLNATQTFTNKTLTNPIISTITNTGTLTLPTTTDTIIGRATTDTITGVKTFSTAPKLTASSNQISIQASGSGNSMIITAANPATSSRIITLPDPGGNDSIVYLNANQTINNKTVNSPIFSGTASGDLISTGNIITSAAIQSGNGYYNNGSLNNFIKLYADQTNVFNVSFSNPATTIVLNFSDPGNNDSVAYLNAIQTLTNKTLTSPTISTITNTGTLTLPTTTDTIMGRATTDTITGVKTFSTAPKLTAASNQISIQASGSGNSMIITAANPATSSRTITLPDPGGNDSISYLAASQTFTNKTLTSPTITGTYQTAFSFTTAGAVVGTLTGVFCKFADSMVLWAWNNLTFTATASSALTPSTASDNFPVGFRPKYAVSSIYSVQTATSTFGTGRLDLGTNGAWSFTSNAQGNNFTSGNDCRIVPGSVMYAI